MTILRSLSSKLLRHVHSEVYIILGVKKKLLLFFSFIVLLSCILFKKLFQILPHFTSYVHFKTLIGFALHVSRTKGYSFKSETSFVELAVNGRISIYNEERQTFSHYQC